MRRRLLVAMLMAMLSAVVSTASQSRFAVDLTGRWVMSFETPQGQSSPRLDLVQDGEKLTGTYMGRYEPAKLMGRVVGRSVEFTVTILVEGQSVDLIFAGEVGTDAASMQGEARLGPLGTTPWRAKRAPSDARASDAHKSGNL
jgi:hypothetical protein